MLPGRQYELIDFHSHYYEPSWFDEGVGRGGPLAQAWPLLTDIERQLEALQDAGIEAKVLSAPPAALLPPAQPPSEALVKRINDRFAELVRRYPDRLLALASVDPFQGDMAAREAERAVLELGLGGMCVDCARGDRLLDAPEARPVFEVAARLGVPVFVHPVSPAGLTERLSRLGHTGVLLARGTEDAASVLALLRSGLLDDLPELKLVLPMMGAAALLFAGIAALDYGRDSGWRGGSPGQNRRRLSVDTMGFDPFALRFALNLLGPEHVLVGSDWPIMPLTPRSSIEEMVGALPLNEEERALVMGGNTRRLLSRPS